MSEHSDIIEQHRQELKLLESKMTVTIKGRHDDTAQTDIAEEIRRDQERIEFLRNEIKKLQSSKPG